MINRHVMLPKEIAKRVPKTHLMSETEWRNLGVQQSQGWVHYMIHQPGIVSPKYGSPLISSPCCIAGPDGSMPLWHDSYFGECFMHTWKELYTLSLLQPETINIRTQTRLSLSVRILVFQIQFYVLHDDNCLIKCVLNLNVCSFRF